MPAKVPDRIGIFAYVVLAFFHLRSCSSVAEHSVIGNNSPCLGIRPMIQDYWHGVSTYIQTLLMHVDGYSMNGYYTDILQT